MTHVIEKTRVYTPESLGVKGGEAHISLIRVLQIIEDEFKDRLHELEARRGKRLKITDVELQNQMTASALEPLVVRSYVYRRDKKGNFEVRVFVHSQRKNTESRIAKATYMLGAAEV
ncbi:MAG: hypothetical protein ACK4KT_06715 [Thermaurantimonas sp.]